MVFAALSKKWTELESWTFHGKLFQAYSKNTLNTRVPYVTSWLAGSWKACDVICRPHCRLILPLINNIDMGFMAAADLGDRLSHHLAVLFKVLKLMSCYKIWKIGY